MNISKNKAMTMILMFAMAISIIALPSAKAQTTQKSYPAIDVTPNPIGVGEQTLIRIAVSQLLPRVDYGWEGLTVEIKDPAGHTTTTQSYRTDSTGGTAFVHVFNEVGTWQVRLHFPAQEVPEGGFYDYERGAQIEDGTVMTESYTDWLDVIVNEEPDVPYPNQPLPSEYWTRPIDPQLRIWALVAGNWRERGVNSVALYNDDAPETAHVLWTTPITTGGLTGGLWYPDVPASSATGDAYEGKFPGAIVLNGILYWQTGGSRGEPANNTYTVATDLHTGKELWRSTTTYSFGQILYFNSYNYDGVFSYLVRTGSVSDDRSTTDVDEGYNYWVFTDPWTDNDLFTWTNLPSGTRFFGPSGEILILEINYANHWMALWNSTATGFARLGVASPDYGSWGNTVHGRTQNITTLGAKCYSWNVTLGDTSTTYQTSATFGVPAMGIYLDEQRVTGLWYNNSGVRTWSVDFDGNEKFDKWWNAPDEWETGFNTIHVGGRSDTFDGGIVFIWNKEQRKHYAFSVETGDYMWATESEFWSDWYGWGAAEHTWFIYEDHLYSTGVGGIVYAYNLATGETDWTYELSDAYNEPVTGLRWWGWITLIADGKVYVGTCEHSAEQPLPRGAPLVCLNATTGEEIWRVNGMYRATRWGGNAVMGDSIYATMDTYDQRVYAVGKGPSATSAEIATDILNEGDMALVKGMVTDISPGTEEYDLRARFPKGVPAVADANQSDWMLYVYKQFAKPADVMGVDVTITVLDPNGNVYDVGTTTSDENGYYQLAFKPPVPGEYTVYATFCGSQAYWGSTAQSALYVNEAPEPTAPATEPPADLTGTYVTGFGIATIAAIVIIGLVILLVLRKR